MLKTLTGLYKNNRNELREIFGALSFLGFIIAGIKGIFLPIVYAGMLLSFIYAFGVKVHAIYLKENPNFKS